MPILNNYSIIEYHGNSNGNTFNFHFRCYSLDHLIVELTDISGVTVQLNRNIDYTVTGGLSNAGGMVTYPLQPEKPLLATGETLRIFRRTPLEQDIDFPPYQQNIENAFDKNIMLLQEMQSVILSANDVLSNTQEALQLSQAAISTANSAKTDADSALSSITQALDTVNQSESKIDLIIEFINDIINSLELETGTENFFTVAGNLEAQITELTSRVTELTNALDDKVDKDPIIQLITSTGEILTDINDNIIHIPFRKEAHA